MHPRIAVYSLQRDYPSACQTKTVQKRTQASQVNKTRNHALTPVTYLSGGLYVFITASRKHKRVGARRATFYDLEWVQEMNDG